jgi:YjbE family integral membrane protein
MIEIFSAIAGIMLVDLVLSGDNALVIGAAAAGLQRRQRWIAILCGGTGAVILRVAFAFLATFLLQLPWLQAIGGVVLLFLAIRLLVDRHKKQSPASQEQERSHTDETKGRLQSASRGLLSALLTILVADVTMSLDNVLAVGALAHGNLLVLSVGILLSISILLIGSALVAELIKWLPWLLDGAALILAWTGANMLLSDLRLGDILNDYAWTTIAVPAVSLGIVLIADLFLRLQDRKVTQQI